MFPVISARVMYTGVTAKDLRDVFKESYGDPVRHWHTSMFPRRFTASGGTIYGMEKRTPRYMRSKAAVKHHHNTLMWTGRLFMQARLARDIRTTSKGGRLVFRGLPSYVWKYWVSKPIKKYEEMVRTLPREAAELQGVFQAGVNKRLPAAQRTRDITRRAGTQAV